MAGTLELVTQLLEMSKVPSRLYYANGSHGTQAGLVLGAKLYSAPYGIHGIAVSGGEPWNRPWARPGSRSQAKSHLVNELNGIEDLTEPGSCHYFGVQRLEPHRPCAQGAAFDTTLV